MNLEIIKTEKNDVELKIDNLTIAEILRIYLNEQEIDLAVWRREHPFKPLIMKIQSSNVKKSVSDAVSTIKKDLDKIASIAKKK
ncbi:hypothetical protein J4217_00790 [Candidatus Pacearchaeota archaeon]|nr:hypothetical protein [Candidatus Pacearchaeota archaeon]